MPRYVAVMTAAVAALGTLAVAVPSASAATEHFMSNQLVSNGSSGYSNAHGSGTNRYRVYANGLTGGSYVCVRIDGRSYECGGGSMVYDFVASGVLKGWAYNGSGFSIYMNAHMTYGE